MRRIPSAPSISRTTNKISPKVELFIVCEGKNTEPEYLLECAKHYGNGMVKVTPIPASGVPMTIVGVAIDMRKDLVQQRKKSRNSFDSCFKVWAMFDRDEHPFVDEALALAQEHRIDVAFSNPCFELWPLLHLIEYGSQDGRHEIQKRLAREMVGYDHEKSAVVNFSLIKDHFDKAYQRAQVLNKARGGEDCYRGCPSTNAGDLVLKIIQNGKKSRNR